MRKMIIDAIKNHWHEDMFPGVKMEIFIRDVIPIYTLLTTMGFNDGNGTVAITGESSKTWIAAYIAVLLKGCTLVIIPKNLSQEELMHYLLITNVNLLITDDNNRKIVKTDNAFYKSPLLKGVYNAESFEWVWNRTDVYNQTIAISNVSREDVILDYKNIENLFTIDYNNDVVTVVTPTSGVDFPGSKYVISSMSSITALIVKSVDLLPYDMGDKIYCNVDFSTSHYLSVLMPFIKGCVFTINPRDAEVFIEDTQSIQTLWRQRVDSVLEVRFLNWLFVKTPFRLLFKGLAIRRLKSYFNKGNKLKSLMIYNWFGSERIISTLRGRLPLFTTYGSQECNQLIAYNDYSSKELNQANCAGRFIRGYEWKVDPDFNELLLNSKSMFLQYHSDLDWTDAVRDALWYTTGDIANVTSDGIVYVYGRKRRLFADNTGFTINLDNMERIIKNIPYINEALLIAFVKGDSIEFTLAIHPDEAFVESKRLGLLQLHKLLMDLAKKLQRDLVGDYKITRVLLREDPFEKTFDGKIERHLYPAIMYGTLS